MVGELSKLPRRDARRRAAELLERFELTDAADRMVKTYSGGMRRRLDLAASLVARPPVLFLDEPTTGLDPTSRQRMWEVIRDAGRRRHHRAAHHPVPRRGRRAGRRDLGDRPRAASSPTAPPPSSRPRVGGEQLEVTLWPAATPRPPAALGPLVAGRDPRQPTTGARLRAPVAPGAGIATAIVRALDDAGIAVDDIEVHHPSLDDVFFALTGRPPNRRAEPPTTDADELVEV